MTFVATAPVKPEKELPHHPFWPAIQPGVFREAMNVDGAVTPERLLHALTEAVVHVNSELKLWRTAQQAAGHETLNAVPDEEPGRLAFLYRRAVYESAAADLMERYIRFDATGAAGVRAEQQEPAIEDHWRNAFWALRDLLGQPRSTVELI
ncbi:MAG: head completion/stabilization protein [Azoarcus sp.]|jgi:hypothetical protein|nr:head completion/stabilization protein [Azoarcus sp.]